MPPKKGTRTFSTKGRTVKREPGEGADKSKMKKKKTPRLTTSVRSSRVGTFTRAGECPPTNTYKTPKTNKKSTSYDGTNTPVPSGTVSTELSYKRNSVAKDQNRTRSQGHQAPDSPEEEHSSATVKPDMCPGGHGLPHATCTPLRCSVDGRRFDPHAGFQDVGDEPPRQGSGLELAVAEEEALAREHFARRDVMFQLRARTTGLVHDLGEDEAEAFADSKLNKLRAVAASDIEWDLKYGDPSERREARRDLLSATGMRNREGAVGITPSIIVNIGQGNDAPPWLQRQARRQLADGEASSETQSTPAPAIDGTVVPKGEKP